MLGPDGGAFESSCIHVTPWREPYGSKLRLCGRVLDAQHNIPVQELLRLEAVIHGRERDREEAGSWHQQEGRTDHMRTMIDDVAADHQNKENHFPRTKTGFNGVPR